MADKEVDPGTYIPLIYQSAYFAAKLVCIGFCPPGGQIA
ncbi:hypothetical protein AVDCRST_MAG81-5350 [uncultured Synechococcales cyanobacterium]|uniref:Uncharacterized protein n=1 Tax=uncultured Synechococcales cyanobacterium TaxID=1936017 RepID=A0A6J4VYJ4_9CYAN|nr:hypothetical protein AVDCRST_MAG81-5350 [uncultured Synechococcales cyanobacterium]